MKSEMQNIKMVKLSFTACTINKKRSTEGFPSSKYHNIKVTISEPYKSGKSSDLGTIN